MKEHPVNILNSLCSLFYHFMKGSPHIQYIDELLQRNLIKNQETWCLLVAKKLYGYMLLEVIEIFIFPFVYKMGSVIK